MVHVILVNHDFKYEIEHLIRIFYPNKRIKFIENPEKSDVIKKTEEIKNSEEVKKSEEIKKFEEIKKNIKNDGIEKSDENKEFEKNKRSLIIETIEPSVIIESKLNEFIINEKEIELSVITSIKVKSHQEKNEFKNANELIETGEQVKSKANELFLPILVSNEKYVKNISGINKIDKSYNKICKEAVKLSFYYAAKKITDIKTPWGILNGIRPTKIVHALLENGNSDEKVNEILINDYAASEEKAALVLEVAKNEKRVLNSLTSNGVGLYVGIPFCPSRCLYCSFVSNSVKSAYKYIEPYIDCLNLELRKIASIVNVLGLKVESIYVGGGTPTSLNVTLLNKLLSEINKNFSLKDVLEFTVEAGRPDTLDKDKLRIMKDCGVSRLSINPQTFNKDTLKTIGRNHTVEKTLEAFELARIEGFNNINMDIIAGLPNETLDIFRATLERVIKLSPENITVHTMSIKRSARLNEKISEFDLTTGDVVTQMVELSQNSLKCSGMHPYYMYRQKNILGNLENVGYSKYGFEGIYNVQIMEEKHSIFSAGCGAVTKVVDNSSNRIERIFNVKEVKDYIERIDEMLARKDDIMRWIK